VVLAIPLSIIGSDIIGDKINGWMGHSKKPKTDTQPGAEQAAGAAKGASAPATDKAKEEPKIVSKVWSNDELVAMVGPKNGEPDNNLRDRVKLYTDQAGVLQIRSVADSQATVDEEGKPIKGIITLEALRAQAKLTTTGEVAGIAFVKLENGNYDPVRILPRPATPDAAAKTR
jgi:hypothetical protein